MQKKALIVEDYRPFQKIFLEALTQFSFDCDMAGSYQEARHLLPRNCYSIAILDARLDEDDQYNEEGLSIARHLFKNDPETAFAIVTGHGTMEIAREALTSYNAVSIFDKNETTPKVLAALIKNLLSVNESRIQKHNFDIMSVLKPNFIEVFQIEDELLRLLKPKGSNLAGLLNNAIIPFFPLLQYASTPGLSTFSKSCQGIFWSRKIGKAIFIHFSSKNLASDEILFKNPNFNFLTKDNLSEIIIQKRTLGVYTFICIISAPRFNEFISNYVFDS